MRSFLTILLIIAGLVLVAAPAAAQTSDQEEALELTRDERRQIQSALADAGFYTDTINGLFGRQTRAAIRAWQASRGEPETGYLDADAAIALLELDKDEEDETNQRAQEQPPIVAKQEAERISAGWRHTCGIRVNGTAVCWGTDDRQAIPPEGERFVSVSSGWVHTCGLRTDGSVVCWGSQDAEADVGQTEPPHNERFLSISSGLAHTCGLRADGSTICWGLSDYGAIAPPADERFAAISSGGAHTCGLRPDGTPLCWGANKPDVDYGQTEPPQGERLVAVSSGWVHTCGLQPDGTPLCWGANTADVNHGQIEPPRGEQFVSISAGREHTCGLRAEGSAVCWGAGSPNVFFDSVWLPPRLADGHFFHRATVPSERFVSISSGEFHACGLRANGHAVCWDLGGVEAEGALLSGAQPSTETNTQEVTETEYQAALKNGTVFPTRFHAVSTFRLRNSGRFPSRFGSEPTSRPVYIPETVRLDGRNVRIAYNGALGGYGYLHPHLNTWVLYDAMSDPVMLDVLMLNNSYYYGPAAAPDPRVPQDDHGDTPNGASELAISVAGRIEHDDDIDYFRFEIFSRSDVTIHTTGDLATVGTLYREAADGTFQSILYRYYGGDGANFSLRRTLPAGTYFVNVVTDILGTDADYNSNVIGDYALHLDVAAAHALAAGVMPMRAMMYWSDAGTGTIQRANLDGTGIEDVVTGLRTPADIALDASRGKMYWTAGGTGRIQGANLDGSGVSDIVTGLDNPYDLAVDIRGGKLYWADRGTYKIQRANLDGTEVEDLVTGHRMLTDVALDLQGAKIYWVKEQDTIERANLDGTAVEAVVTELSDARRLALDVQRGRMYWTSYWEGMIQSAKMDGTIVEAVFAEGPCCLSGIALDGERGKMYWTNHGEDVIQRANLDGTNVEVVASTGVSRPGRIALFTPDQQQSTPAQPDQPREAEPARSALNATISGTITFRGEAKREPAVLNMEADPVCAEKNAESPKTEQAFLLDGSKGLANVLIQVKSGLPDMEFAPAAEELVFTQSGCIYDPHVLVIRVGQTVKILSPDGTLHIVHVFGKVNAEFNQAMPSFQTEIERVFDQVEDVPFAIKCDVHPWMNAFGVVLDHPYAAVTAADGSYSIPNLPAGTYQVEVWHELLGSQTHAVTVAEGGTTTLDLALLPPDADQATRATGEKVYWTNRMRSRIQRANLDGSHVEDLVTRRLPRPRGIALDVQGEKMY